MKLYTFDGIGFMAHCHDDAVVSAGADHEFLGQTFWIDHQRMIAHGREGILDIAKYCFGVVRHFRQLAVHDRWRANNLTAVGGADGLMAQTDAEDGNPCAEAFDRVA